MDTSPIRRYRHKNKVTQSALADLVGTSREYIARLEADDQSITADMAVRIEDATSGQVSRSDLRPDLWPAQPETKATA